MAVSLDGKSAIFTVPGKPVAMQRARSRGNRFYTPRETREYQSKVAICCPASLKVGHKGAVSLALDIYDEEIVVCVTLLAAPAPKRKGGDGDNIFKNVADALEKAGVYGNDRQITRIEVTDRRQQ